ncbi:putative O-succinylbenzoic acid--CoA ligase MenE [Rhodococcoides trifolii]|uniref:O-succinylbenzoic acid--CoA ligase MenE n=1 Tax=Rhodococcoides trifolii TaxID=908250 RepID=A0A917FRA4_9NOCA|nr:o-succinylbenzoate--CoA ligase [Rhodococcus trifolii]GGF96072.1 putative O-succinylbenzoic acid--CoA ligase MenE [Rhodococcus trifolii]
MTAVLRTLAVPSGPAVSSVLPILSDILSGAADPILPVPADDARDAARLTDALAPGAPIEDGVALVVATSGSTGIPKGALLSAAALRASASATHARLGGAGSWLLALPAHHIAGMQVLLRSIAANTEPVVLDVRHGFDPNTLPAAIENMDGPRRYTSLVPTQLIKVLDNPAATAALASLDAVLLGGAATPAPVLARAVDAGITVVRTYGMSETCGGCVYDGVPLDGVTVSMDASNRPASGLPASGRVFLGGATLASGYRGLPDHPAFAEPGLFRTDDAGVLTENGVLRIVGRLDEAITTGGLTVVPQVVEAALATHDGIAECAVVGVSDARLGERVAVAIVPARGSTVTLDDVRAHVAQSLNTHASPREMLLVDALPLRGPGKVDRAAVRSMFTVGG